MIPWPQMASSRPPTIPPDVMWPQPSARAPEPLEAPDRSPPPAAAGPSLPPPVAETPIARHERRAAMLVAALTASTAAHAAVFGWLLVQSPPQGAIVRIEPVTVELAFEAPQSELPPVSGAEADSVAAAPVESPLPSPAEPEAAPKPLANAEPDVPASLLPAQPDLAEQPASEDLAASSPSAPDTRKPEQPVPAAEALEPIAESGDIEELAVEEEPQLPDRASLPSPRPQREAEQPKAAPAQRTPIAEEAARRQKTARAPARAAKADSKLPSHRPAPSSQEAAVHSQRGSGGAAAAASFSRRLLAHVERHKSYPAEAQRLRISGATRLSITIDRNGRLSGAHITARSGHTVLDQEALAVARRAAPYPKAPDGVGGPTISFAVTLRFSR